MDGTSLLELVPRLGETSFRRKHRSGLALLELIKIITLLPAPIAYIAEAPLDEGGLWLYARDILSSVLLRQGISVVDPDTLRCIAQSNPDAFTEEELKSPNIFLDELATREGILTDIYLPKGYGEKDPILSKLQQERAEHLKIKMHYWRATSVLVANPRLQVTYNQLR